MLVLARGSRQFGPYGTFSSGVARLLRRARRDEELAGHIPWHKVDLSLRAQRTIWISTTRPDGRPHAAPVWFCWDGMSLYFITKRGTQKAKNLTRQAWVVAHVGDGDDAIILEGAAEVVDDQHERDRVDTLYREKYVDPHSGARATVHEKGSDLYGVRVKRAMAWEYGVVATRTDWRTDT